MKHFVDARGLSCPLPVVHTKNEISLMKEGEAVEVLVDNEIAVQNLTKFANVRNHSIKAEKLAENEFRAVITVGRKGEEAEEKEKDTANEESCSVFRRNHNVVAISSDRMGEGEEALGKTLMKAFLFALTKQDSYPEAIYLYNSGAFLSCEGSDSLEDLKFLEAEGVSVYTCGTCLNFYGLTESLAVGCVTNMYDIVENLSKAEKIIKP
ncbi:MAG: sulfurtransferase-like selenium metabolism protein YedF [Fusicatenibacter sp.]|nr:sulfurtransferase-like selenium metabolism protein YedF [Lachnospiraceae bacterium]MDY2937715.1 sulfurtransferase-like selenium metabolism protein YedF [Fusicatenibacter sp.]